MALSDNEIFECIDRKNEYVVDSVSKMIDSYTRTITQLITTENQNIKHSIDELARRVEKQNGSVADLKIWKAGMDERERVQKEYADKEHKGGLTVLQILALVIMGLGVFGSLYFNGVNMSRQKDIAARQNAIEGDISLLIENSSIKFKTRGNIVPFDSLIKKQEHVTED